MIKGLSADNARPFPQQTAKRKTEKTSENFSDQLLGAKSEPSQENPKRTERKTSGRDQDRGDQRSAEREQDSRSSKSDLRERRLEGRRDDVRAKAPNRDVPRERDDERDERDEARETSVSAMPQVPSSHIQQPTTRVPASDDDAAPIVVEKPKSSSDSQELQLPDFFSKAALEKGATKSVKAGGKGENEATAALAEMKENEGLTRQEAMEKFVTKMNDELGIPPQKLLEAFAKLDEKAMAEAPEKSMGQFLGNLDLDEAGEAKATALYKDLLKTTGDSLMNERLAGLDKSVNFDVESPRDAALRKLNNSLDDLNKSFFRKEGVDKKQAQKDLESMDVALAKLMHEPKSAEASGLGAGGAASANANANALAQAQSAMVQDVQADDAEDAQVSPLSSQSNPQSELLAALGLQPGQQANSEAESDLLGGGEKREMMPNAGGAKAALKSAFAEEISKADKDERVETDSAIKPDAKLDPQALAQQDVQAPNAPKAVMGPADMMMSKQPTAQDEQDNVKELVKQAQIMVKRGGGEMKMEMKPEGMGAVQLRVNVENGQVSVQMLTESESAKHLLEKGLHELKSNLAQHELKVQSMTVDVGNDVKNKMDQQATQDQARHRAQQFAQDFMGSFRDEQQGFRQGFLDNKGWRSYARGKGPESVGPEQVERATSKARSDNNKRLNLVA